MQTSKIFFLALASFSSVTTLAAPAPEATPSDGCIFPAEVFETLENPFQLTALIPGDSYGHGQSTWPVQVFPRDPSNDVSSKPVISRSKIAQPYFTLVEGKLIYEGLNAELESVLAIFPPPLQPFVWNVPREGNTDAGFYAAYACDSEGNQILELFDTVPNSRTSSLNDLYS